MSLTMEQAIHETLKQKAVPRGITILELLSAISLDYFPCDMTQPHREVLVLNALRSLEFAEEIEGRWWLKISHAMHNRKTIYEAPFPFDQELLQKMQKGNFTDQELILLYCNEDTGPLTRDQITRWIRHCIERIATQGNTYINRQSITGKLSVFVVPRFGIA
jgi:hypothetical protein